ncbi:MAG: polysaccharide biosynthesis protein [Prevotella sp.]|jgi:FlaA1/EpsC-like NDP-sugar epimerase
MRFLNKLVNWYFSKDALPYWCVLLIDIAITYLSGIFVFWLYYHGAVTLGNLGILSKTMLIYILINLVGFRLFHTYSGIIRYSSFVDLRRVGLAMTFNCFIALIVHYIIYFAPWSFVRLQGRQIIAIYVVTMLTMWIFRVLVKSLYDVSFSSDKGLRTLIYGVKEGGVGLGKAIRNQKPSRFQLKGFITDDNKYHDKILLGVRVYSVGEQLADVLKDKNIQAVVVSPLQSDKFRNNQELQDLLIEQGIKIFMASDAKAWNPKDDFSHVDLKPISIEDLLPRQQIEVNMKDIGEMLKGKCVMITGDAGSIGTEMVRQIASFEPSNMVLIDQAETPQYDIRLLMRKEFPNVKFEAIVLSITRADRMEHIFETCHPDYVFHAAAYKHVPMMEDNPSEAILNNVVGTKVLADLSVKYGVKKFVMISTDKAVNPTNIMGCSKRICEIYCQSLDHEEKVTKKGGTQFVTTRFGNVLGSNGSVIPLFKKQIIAGGPLTVTDPNIIRYFMLIPEACKLVLEAGTHGNGGEIFVFDMGKPVRIADLARRMILLSGARNVEIKYTGLRPGEKLYEEVLSNTKNTLPSFHEKIRIAKVREYDYKTVSKEIDELIRVAHTFDAMAVAKKMKEIVPEFISNNSVYSVLDKKNNVSQVKEEKVIS